MAALGAVFFAAAPASFAQEGPPPHVRAAVRATADMLRSEGDAPIQQYIAQSMAPDPSRDARATLERLRALRTATQGRLERVGAEAAPEGVILELSGPAGEAQIDLRFTETGAITHIALLNAGGGGGGGGGGDGGAQRHLRAIEDLAALPLNDGLARFERDHFSAAFMARTSPAERRALLQSVRDAVAGAGAVTIQRRNDEFILNLRGGASHDVAITLEPNAPRKIETMELRSVTAASSLDLTPQNLTQTFDALASNGFSGVVYIERDGQELLHRAYGVANPELNTPVSIDTVFGIGSTPIDFTIASIQLLAQRGAISMDDRIGRYFPHVPRDKRTMTIAQLMSGRSGLADFFHTDADWNPDLAWIDREEAERRILASELRFAPGAGRAHSHAAFVLLAALIERVSGKTYYAFIRENFLDPAGMTRTGIYGETRGLNVRDFAVGPGPSIVGVPNIPPNWGPTSWLIMGSGGMYSTLDDMQHFFDYIRSGRVLQGQYLASYMGQSVGVGGSDQGFYIFNAYNGANNTALMLVNMEGRSDQMQQLSQALARFVGAER